VVAAFHPTLECQTATLCRIKRQFCTARDKSWLYALPPRVKKCIGDFPPCFHNGDCFRHSHRRTFFSYRYWIQRETERQREVAPRWMGSSLAQLDHGHHHVPQNENKDRRSVRKPQIKRMQQRPLRKPHCSSIGYICSL
jgi:hypothetical protein